MKDPVMKPQTEKENRHYQRRCLQYWNYKFDNVCNILEAANYDDVFEVVYLNNGGIIVPVIDDE